MRIERIAVKQEIEDLGPVDLDLLNPLIEK